MVGPFPSCRRASAASSCNSAILESYRAGMEFVSLGKEAAIESTGPSQTVIQVANTVEEADVASRAQVATCLRVLQNDATIRGTESTNDEASLIERDTNASFSSLSTVSRTSSCDSIESYYAPNFYLISLNVQRRVRELEEEMMDLTTPEQRRAHLRLKLGAEPQGFQMKVYLAYMTAHGDDLPAAGPPDSTRQPPVRVDGCRLPGNSYDHTLENQQVVDAQKQLFGDWSWPAEQSTQKGIPVAVGPKGELIEQSGLLPRGMKCQRERSRFREHMEGLKASELEPEGEPHVESSSESGSGSVSTSGSSLQPKNQKRHWLRGLLCLTYRDEEDS